MGHHSPILTSFIVSKSIVTERGSQNNNNKSDINTYIQALFNVKHAIQSNPKTAPLYILPPLQCAQESLRTETPYDTAKGIP
jgi:hypothetical protein